jgi:uncharacterized protein YciI
MKNLPNKITQIVPLHVEYWKSRNLEKYTAGPFADKSGGLISFAATNFEEAEGMMVKDPFISEDLIDSKWLKEWIPES